MILNDVIVLSWLMLIVGGAVFVGLYGRPWKRVDKVMAWHVSLLALVAALEPVALLLAAWSLLPSAIVYVGSVGLLYWRLVMVIRARRRRP